MVLCINIVAIIIAWQCAQGNSTCGSSWSNGIISFFFDIDNTTDLGDSGGINVNSNYREQIDNTLTPQSSGISLIGTVGIFLDALKMVLGLIALFTPLPMLVLIFSFAFPLFFSLPIFAVVFVLWTISIAEFVSGKEF